MTSLVGSLWYAWPIHFKVRTISDEGTMSHSKIQFFPPSPDEHNLGLLCEPLANDGVVDHVHLVPALSFHLWHHLSPTDKVENSLRQLIYDFYNYV